MDIQATLTLTIQAVVMSFVALMVFDFIDGLWVVPLPPIEWKPSVIEQPTVSATSPQPPPQQEIQQATPRAIAFEKIPDPWTLEPQSPHHSVLTPAVIIPFPRLRLLPPAFLCNRSNPSGLKQNRPRLRNPPQLVLSASPPSHARLR
ncbi:hypothetical protein [Nostoc sp. NMS8]|uniref:hypothetical protein n=1 Tax=Nostoc sp. NMS8 TaxID=2815392 RepID=UPI0025E13E1C|nr:hypothetical protein [Nostoc sp. NMS8]